MAYQVGILLHVPPSPLFNFFTDPITTPTSSTIKPLRPGLFPLPWARRDPTFKTSIYSSPKLWKVFDGLMMALSHTHKSSSAYLHQILTLQPYGLASAASLANVSLLLSRLSSTASFQGMIVIIYNVHEEHRDPGLRSGQRFLSKLNWKIETLNHLPVLCQLPRILV